LRAAALLSQAELEKMKADAGMTAGLIGAASFAAKGYGNVAVWAGRGHCQ
jgi:hypothetical protein